MAWSISGVFSVDEQSALEKLVADSEKDASQNSGIALAEFWDEIMNFGGRGFFLPGSNWF